MPLSRKYLGIIHFNPFYFCYFVVVIIIIIIIIVIIVIVIIIIISNPLRADAVAASAVRQRLSSQPRNAVLLYLAIALAKG